MADKKVGLFFIGGLGSTASLSIFTIALLQQKIITEDKNFVSSLKYFSNVRFLKPSEIFVIGGVDIRKDDLYHNIKLILQRDNLNVDRFLNNSAIRRILENWSKNLEVGIFSDNVQSNKKSIDKIKNTISDFIKRYKLDTTFVIYLSSAEEHIDKLDRISLSQLKRIISSNDIILRPNILYTYAAIDLGLPFINFTSCQANSIDAIKELAELRKVPHCGKDAKTGETYIKSILAPAFKYRNIHPLFWESHNILGDNDGLTLQDYKLKKDKLIDKALSVKELGNDIEHNVRIDFVKALGDWKTAWNLIEWEGLLGSRMSLQFVWKGHDGLLAAPLIWDLIRFMECSIKMGEYGVLKHLAFFFKNPIDCSIYNAIEQFELLKNHYIPSKRNT